MTLRAGEGGPKGSAETSSTAKCGGAFRGTSTALVLAVACVITFAGFRLFWFMTDDAYIAFRYVSNSMMGRGLVWNPPPFRPVEGYTSFLWVCLLRITWTLTGLKPPQVANWLSLFFGYGQLAVVVATVLRMQMPGTWPRFRTPLLALVLVGILSNRTFLAWLSSGLETSFFCWCFISFVVVGLRSPCRRTTGWAWLLSSTAAAAALVRPDGLLCAAVALLLVADEVLGARPVQWRKAVGLVPLLLIPCHLLWRRWTYGEWLPNTYYAKVVAPWPEAGLRYLASFVLEYGLWLWLLLTVVALGKMAYARRSDLLQATWRNRHVVVVIGAVIAHAGYYVWRVGGDHFEYRIFAHLIPLIWLSVAYLALHLWPRRVVPAFAAITLLLLVSLPIPWMHWELTHELSTRKRTHFLASPVAPALPSWMGPIASRWDGLQAWLIKRHICMRHQEHKIFAEAYMQSWPTREQAELTPWEPGHPVMFTSSVGIPGWVMPNVAIIDKYGLNDYVIARNPATGKKRRGMAHARRPPPGYVECFEPNTRRRRRRIQVQPREQPLTDQDIVECERRYAARLSLRQWSRTSGL